jgi:hypothetical protein
MRWLIIGLLVSMGGLLLAAAGVARHVLLQRRRLKHKPPDSDASALGTPEESDLESES